MLDCIFCRIAAREVPAQLVFEDAEAVAFKDTNPQAPTHVLVVPKRHVENLAASGEADAPLLGHLQRVSARVASELGLSSFRLVLNCGRGAGQSVDHLHYHLLGGRSMRWPPG